ncbi:hypothetical protein QQ054_38570 [Oscillatoria amoena NRMC-F 0135]|nr:hypothetical protein [Oscillatoria amoena NRMC-F 0135]
MENSEIKINDKRYYYFVALEGNLLDLKSIIYNCLNIKTVKNSFNSDSYDIENVIVESNLQFFNSNQDNSVNGDGQPPFQYTVFIVGIPNSEILVLGFPFKSLAKEITNKLSLDRNLLKSGSYLKPRFDDLILLDESKFTNDDWLMNFSSLDLELGGESDVSSVRLSGDRPINSTLYKKTFLSLIKKDECSLTGCSLKCQVVSSEYLVTRSRANIHVDLYGNYKFYVHTSGRNVNTIAYLFIFLKKYNCIKSTFINPINKLKDNDE